MLNFSNGVFAKLNKAYSEYNRLKSETARLVSNGHVGCQNYDPILDRMKKNIDSISEAVKQLQETKAEELTASLQNKKEQANEINLKLIQSLQDANPQADLNQPEVLRNALYSAWASKVQTQLDSFELVSNNLKKVDASFSKEHLECVVYIVASLKHGQMLEAQQKLIANKTKRFVFTKGNVIQFEEAIKEGKVHTTTRIENCSIKNTVASQQDARIIESNFYEDLYKFRKTLNDYISGKPLEELAPNPLRNYNPYSSYT